MPGDASGEGPGDVSARRTRAAEALAAAIDELLGAAIEDAERERTGGPVHRHCAMCGAECGAGYREVLVIHGSQSYTFAACSVTCQRIIETEPRRVLERT